MNFLRNLFYVEVETLDGPRIVSRFSDYLSIFDSPARVEVEEEEAEEEVEEEVESLESLETDESIEEEVSSSLEEEEVERSVRDSLDEILNECSSEDAEDPFIRRDYEHILARIDALLSNLNGFLQVPETVTGTQPNGTIIRKKEGKVFLSRKQNSYEVGVIIEDHSFKLVASYRE